MRALDYRFLPCPGGLLDQPADLMEDIAYLASIYAFYREQEQKRRLEGDLSSKGR